MWCRAALHVFIAIAAAGGTATRSHAASPDGMDRQASADLVAQSRQTFESAAVSTGAAAMPASPKRSVPADSLGALGTRLHPFDIVTVRTTAGTSVKGRFSHATDASVTLALEQGARDIPVRDVLDVRRQNGRLAGRGAAIGFLFGAGLANLAALSAGGDGETRVSENLIFGTFAGGGGGALWGALIGAFHHRQELVYRAPEPTVQLSPILGRSQSGVMFSMRF